MKRILLTLVSALLIVCVQGIIVETASLSNFLMGRETNCTYDNWISHLAEGIAIEDYNLYAPYDVQTTGFGDFRIPNALELIYWNNMLDLFVAGDYDGAQALLTANTAPFEIVEFHDTDTGRIYYMIRETPNLSYYDDNGTFDTYDDETGAFAYGWGLFISNPEATKPIIITIPHPCDDFPSPMIGYQAFKTWDAAYLLINGAGREVRWTNEGTYTNSKSISDPTRYALHPFQTAYKKFADKTRDQYGWREFSVQLHTSDWNRHAGYASCQISAGNPRACPNLPIRDLSPLKYDLLNKGSHLMIPANTFGLHRDVYLNDYYTVNYSTYDFTFDDGVNNYPVNNYMDLPAYQQNQQMLYTQNGMTDYDVYDPFFHMEMDELPIAYLETENVLNWFYGWNLEEQRWSMEHLFDHFLAYYSLWIADMNPVLEQMFTMTDGMSPAAPTNLSVLNQSLNNVTLTWDMTSDYDFSTYEVLYATEPIGLENYQVYNRDNSAMLASPNCESIQIPNLTNANPYYFRIRAKDKNGNVSALSNEVNTILAPANITSFTAHGMDNSVRLYWGVNGQTNNQGFNVYRSDDGVNFTLLDGWQTNTYLANIGGTSFEWWDNTALNSTFYIYKISSTNLNNIEFYHNFPASASPRALHTLTLTNPGLTLTDNVTFGENPYASDGSDAYWDVTKANPGTTYVWNAFWEQYWGSSGTQLAREIKGGYDLDEQIKTWVLRTRSDQLNETLTLTASGNFDRLEKLYLQDGTIYHDLLSAPYQYVNANANIRTMTLFWGNMQPKVFIGYQPNRIYQGAGTINFNWSYQYPFLVDHLELSVQNATDSLLVSSLVTNAQTAFAYTVPPNLTEMQDCRFIVDLYTIDGVRTRYTSDFHFSMVPYMNMAFNMDGWKTRSNPWLNADLSFEQVFGPGSTGYVSTPEGWSATTDYDFGNAYWVHSPDIFFYSNINPVQTNEYSFNLVTGWNFIPNPHLCTYELADLSFTLNGTVFRYSEMLAQGLVSRAIYVYRDGVYQLADSIQPFEAIMFKFYGSVDLVPMIRFFPFYGGPEIDPPAPDWEMIVKVSQNNTASQMHLGMHPLADDGFDFRYDLPLASPPPFEMAQAWFPIADTDSLALESQLATDFRNPFDQPLQQKFWNFNLQVDNTSPVTFDFEQLGIPTGWQVMLMLDDSSFYVGSAPNWVWTPPATGIYEGYVRVSNYMVGNDDLIQSPLSALTAYPNPFNPDVNIAFNLASSSKVQVGIYNIKGQKVADLVNEQLRGGSHILRWNGKDTHGSNVASGIYFARVHTKDKTQIIKMMLMK